MYGFLQQADDVLRRRPWTTGAAGVWSALGRLAAEILVFGLAYGAVMGLFGGILGERFLQVLYSALKVPLLLLVTFLLGLPNFFVLNSLFGLRRDFPEAIRALMAAQAALAILLASLAPLTALWYASSANYSAATLLNALMFAVASLGAQGLLRGYYAPLIARNPKHRWMLWTWLVLYAFVGIQMAWMLRPFVGDPNLPVQFFRDQRWENAYVQVFRIFWSLVTRGR
jgi:hypothetical protein